MASPALIIILKKVMSHVKNLQAFEKLLGVCTGLEGRYNPGNQNLQVNAMATLLSLAQQSWEEVKEAAQAYDLATNNRQLGFERIRKLSSNVYSMLRACGANELALKDAQNARRRVWGARITETPVDEVGKPIERPAGARPSYSRSYAVIVEYFERLVTIVATDPLYGAYEPELTIASLQETVVDLHRLNKAVTDAEVALDEARRRRNTIWYLAQQNLVDTAISVRSYVRGAFGFQSQQHLQIQKIRFTKPPL